ncbi:ABC transporter ABCA1-like protein [Leptotrombidium deliense]|uniref:ABC transporter ABCA1-like protein n=1 Tax=Leptotrombidium deliense TaxID=299467 RepID=A0A443RTL9_9ACAR|nr:ABC transporter ABCA1-like protein [Leptotrombidium deliense]
MFFDEPTAGVDPVARRKIWSIIESCRDTIGSSIVLTSHSMDECENLCSVIGIMVKGSFKCMGSTQHLKTKFGRGYTITLKISSKFNNAKEVSAEMKSKLPSAKLQESHLSLLVFHFEDPSVSLGNVFRILETIKKNFKLEDYQLTDSNLEQIFLTFAKEK